MGPGGPDTGAGPVSGAGWSALQSVFPPAATDALAVGTFVSPVEFADQISFEHDVSARQLKLDLSLTPYLRDVLAACDFEGHGHREITIMAVEQTGKSLSWQVALLWSFEHAPGLSLVVYPSDELCDEVNRVKLQPLMRGIPALARHLDMPLCKARNRYNFPGFVSYFQGSGERISAHSARVRIADELDDWIEHEGCALKLDDLRKRGRTFADSLLIKCSSPKGEKSAINSEYERSSRGAWHLRCLGCGKPTIQSSSVHHLQFETVGKDDERRVAPGSERLICPACKHEHLEADRRGMNMRGKFIHKFPERVESLPGFQWGALASQWESLGWTQIAERQLLAGRSASLEEQVYFDNSIRGLPFRPRKIQKEQHEALLDHCAAAALDPATIEAVFLSVDSQDAGWKWEARALDIHSCRWQLGFGMVRWLSMDEAKVVEIRAFEEPQAKQRGEEWTQPKTLADIMREGFLGLPVALCLIDEGGHRKDEVEAFVQETPRAYSYKGGIKTYERYKLSKNQEKLVLARRDDYQDALLYYLYFQPNQENNYWWLLPREQVTDEYLAEVAAVRSMPKLREGHLRKNWHHEGRVHDYFDTGLIYLCLEDMAIDLMPASEWRHGKAEVIRRRAQEEEDESDPQPAEGSGKAWVQRYGV